jgi:hypothetical protein
MLKHLQNSGKLEGYKALRTSISTKVIGMKEVVAGNVPNYLNWKDHPKSFEELEKLHNYFAKNIKEKYADDEEELK